MNIVSNRKVTCKALIRFRYVQLLFFFGGESENPVPMVVCVSYGITSGSRGGCLSRSRGAKTGVREIRGEIRIPPLCLFPSVFHLMVLSVDDIGPESLFCLFS